jgi:ABC-type polysaccharide/polyol phosphate export permease
MVVIRNPLMGLLPPLNSIFAVMLITVMGWTVTYFAFSFFRKRIAYWV